MWTAQVNRMVYLFSKHCLSFPEISSRMGVVNENLKNINVSSLMDLEISTFKETWKPSEGAGYGRSDQRK